MKVSISDIIGGVQLHKLPTAQCTKSNLSKLVFSLISLISLIPELCIGAQTEAFVNDS